MPPLPPAATNPAAASVQVALLPLLQRLPVLICQTGQAGEVEGGLHLFRLVRRAAGALCYNTWDPDQRECRFSKARKTYCTCRLAQEYCAYRSKHRAEVKVQGKGQRKAGKAIEGKASEWQGRAGHRKHRVAHLPVVAALNPGSGEAQVLGDADVMELALHRLGQHTSSDDARPNSRAILLRRTPQCGLVRHCGASSNDHRRNAASHTVMQACWKPTVGSALSNIN